MVARKKPSSTKSALSSLARELAKIPAEEVAPPKMPVDRLIGEARVLAKTVDGHLDALSKVGLDRRLATSLLARAEALAEAQSLRMAARGARRSDEERALEAEGVTLRSEMVADLRYVLRHDPDVQRQVDAVQEGEGLDDLVQDLRDLSTLFAPHAALLRKASVDAKTKAALARKIGKALEARVAERRAQAGIGEERAAIELRDRAATYLEHAMGEVRAAGLYAFRGKPAVQAKFRSDYAAAQRQRAKSKAARAGAPAPDAG